jgi:hypothetical protein
VTPLPAAVLARLPAVTALLQHLCVGAASARAELRGAVAEAIAQLRAALPHSLRRAFLRFLLRFGRSTRVPQRLLAVEVAARLLAVGGVDASADGALDFGGAGGGAGGGEGGSAGTPAVLSIALSEGSVPSEADIALEVEG